MRIVLDTNVLVSGIFFSGPPFQVLKAWKEGHIRFAISPEILAEYHRVSEVLGSKFGNLEVERILTLIALNSDLVEASNLSEPVCEDQDDDKFIACALAADARIIVTGDKQLLKVSGYQGITILPPSVFVDKYHKEPR